MHFVAVKQVWQQDIQSLRRIRQRLIENRTSLINEVRGLLLEYGIFLSEGSNGRRMIAFRLPAHQGAIIADAKRFRQRKRTRSFPNLLIRRF